MSLSLAPVAPLWLIAAGVLLLVLPALRTRFWPQGVARIGLALALMLALLQPMTTIEERAPRADIGVLLVDDSASMALEQGRAQAAAARAVLEKAAPGLEWRTLTLRNAPRAGTELAPVLQRALAGVDPTRLAGAVVLTDGRIADAATLAGLNLPKRPVHILVTGKRDRPDLQVRVEQAAVYAPVGRVVPVRFTVEGGAPGQAVRVDWRRQDGKTGTVEAIIGQPQTLSVPVLQRGTNLVVFSVPPVGQEIVTANNQALASITGMRDRLNVLLVSGAPGLSGRLWRDMLKSDPNITLVHFTILRFPTSLDPTPAREMALIPFPVEQLFEERLPQFDLIILDRFDEFDLVPDYYIAGMRDFVERGGAVLVTGGSDLARLDGLAASSLGPALPVRLTGGLSTQPFRPRVAKAGEVHPVTEGLQDVWPGGRDWGRWETLAEAEPRRGDTLLTDEAGRPLLVLAPFGKGRVATLLSGDVWRWARGVDGGGPRDELLRRLAHWLMREPDLEDMRLSAEAAGGWLDVKATSLRPPASVEVIGPNDRRQVAPLVRSGEYQASARLTAANDGLYMLRAGGRATVATVGNPAEMSADPAALAQLRTFAQKTGGQLGWLEDGTPQLRRVPVGARAAGAGWIGMVENRSGALIRVDSAPVLPPLLVWGLVALAAGVAWWTERR